MCQGQSVPGPSCPVLPGWAVLVKDGLSSTLEEEVAKTDALPPRAQSWLETDAVDFCTTELRLLSVELDQVYLFGPYFSHL